MLAANVDDDRSSVLANIVLLVGGRNKYCIAEFDTGWHQRYRSHVKTRKMQRCRCSALCFSVSQSIAINCTCIVDLATLSCGPQIPPMIYLGMP